MTREIKFRLIKNDEIVGYERWNSLAGKWCYDTNPNGAFGITNDFIPHADKEQYTGVKDKDKVEMYDGDIFSAGDFGNVLVFWNDVLHEWSTQSTSGLASLSDWTHPDMHKINYPVCGNIHQNKDLL